MEKFSTVVELRTSDAIVQYLGQQLGFIATRQQIRDALDLTIGQLSALYRLKVKGKITNPSLGVWKLILLYRKIRHTKRIVETRQNRKRPLLEDCDCEGTCEGYAPYHGQPDPPDVPPDSYTKRMGDVINPYLAKSILLTLSRQDPPVMLAEELTTLKPTCEPRLVMPHGQFCIEGTEWLDDILPYHDPNFQVEVVFQGSTGRLYPYHDHFTIGESEYN